MSLSLHAVTIPSFLQIIGAVSAFMQKAELHCSERNMAAEDLIGARLAPDMFPLAYQVKSVRHHSLGAIEGLRRGVFSPDTNPPPDSFAGLRDILADAEAGLSALDPAELNSFVGKDMLFQFGDFKMPFTAENFLLSFSQPNFYFHAVTAYDILRSKGVALGKRDFLGRLRLQD